MADSSTDSSADCPVGMAYLLGDWATDRRATERRQLISSMFDISLPTDRPATAIAQRSVAQGHNNQVGMAFTEYLRTRVEYHFEIANGAKIRSAY